MLQFLSPILNLLKSDITRCSNLVLAGNTLPPADLEGIGMYSRFPLLRPTYIASYANACIVEILKTGKISSLNVSSCGMCEKDLLTLVAPILDYPQPLRSLNLSENLGRLPAAVLPHMLHHLTELRVLNLRGSLQGGGDMSDTLIPYKVLDRLQYLQELDISGFKVRQRNPYQACACVNLQPPRLTLQRCKISGASCVVGPRRRAGCLRNSGS